MKTFEQFVLEMETKTRPKTQVVRVDRPVPPPKQTPTQNKTPDLVSPAIKTGVGAALRSLGAGTAAGLAGSILSEPSSRTGDATLRGAVKSGDYKPTNKEKKQLFDR